MVRPARALAFLLCFAPCAPCGLRAADSPAPPAASTDDELKVLHQMLDQQSRQLDVLAQEIARLNMLIEEKGAPASGPASAPAEQPDTAAPAEPAPVQPVAAPAGPVGRAGPVHIVAKGETLTAIAKRYKVTVADLLKVNKIADVRKLRIGQSLALPPGAKVQDSPAPQQ